MKDKNTLIILAGTVLLVALILAFILNRESRPAQQDFNQEIQQIEQQSTSDDPEEIEEDLMNTDMENIDRELQDIDQELDAAY